MYCSVVMAGFGGQGIMLIGNLLAQAGMEAGRNVTFFPVYGAEMRGGTANCTVVVSESEIGSPVVRNPLATIIMNKPSLDKFQPRLCKGGAQIVNTSIVEDGFDEAIVTSYDGSIYVFDGQGDKDGDGEWDLLWSFQAEATLYTSCVITDEDGERYILTGGIDHHVYKLDMNGNEVGRFTLPAQAIAQLKTGIITEDGVAKEYVVVVYKNHDKTIDYCCILDPTTMENYRTIDIRKANYNADAKHLLIGEMEVADIDGDGNFESTEVAMKFKNPYMQEIMSDWAYMKTELDGLYSKLI